MIIRVGKPLLSIEMVKRPSKGTSPALRFERVNLATISRPEGLFATEVTDP